jgi:hypothetical protein
VRQPRVEILFVADCPNLPAARALVDRVAGELHVTPDVRLIEVGDFDDAQRLRFLGSPTVRVDGRDVEPGAGRRGDFVLACRLGPPLEDWVRDALEAVA